jgi:hypothetical protein
MPLFNGTDLLETGSGLGLVWSLVCPESGNKIGQWPTSAFPLYGFSDTVLLANCHFPGYAKADIALSWWLAVLWEFSRPPAHQLAQDPGNECVGFPRGLTCVIEMSVYHSGKCVPPELSEGVTSLIYQTWN